MHLLLELRSFDSHRFFERYIAKFFYNHIISGDGNTNRRLNANGNKFFRFISHLFLLFDRKPLKKNVEIGFGNVLMVLKKQSN